MSLCRVSITAWIAISPLSTRAFSDSFCVRLRNLSVGGTAYASKETSSMYPFRTVTAYDSPLKLVLALFRRRVLNCEFFKALIKIVQRILRSVGYIGYPSYEM